MMPQQQSGADRRSPVAAPPQPIVQQHTFVAAVWPGPVSPDAVVAFAQQHYQMQAGQQHQQHQQHLRYQHAHEYETALLAQQRQAAEDARQPQHQPSLGGPVAVPSTPVGVAPHLPTTDFVGEAIASAQRALAIEIQLLQVLQQVEQLRRLAAAREQRQHLEQQQSSAEEYRLAVAASMSAASAGLPRRADPDAVAMLPSAVADAHLAAKLSDVHGDCRVCLESFAENQEVAGMACGEHVFHAGCIRRWLENSTACPLCRTELPAAP